MSDKRITPRFVLRTEDDDGTQALVDTHSGEEVGYDGGEPEDNMFVRDWAWVPVLLNKMEVAHQQTIAEIADLHCKLLESADECGKAQRTLDAIRTAYESNNAHEIPAILAGVKDSLSTGGQPSQRIGGD